MASRHPSVAGHRILAGTALAILTVCVAWTASAPAAAPLERLDTSLRWIPEDAAFYSTMLRGGEQVRAIVKSRAFAAVRALPAVRDAVKRFTDEMQSGEYAEQVKTVWKNPEVQNALRLLGDMFSQEAFVYADQGAVDLLELLQRVYNSFNYRGTLAHLTGEEMDADQTGAFLVAALAEHIELLKVPNIIVGFRVKNRDLAVQELAKLEATVNVLLMFVPQVSGKWKRTAIEGNDYLTLTLDGSMIPWEQIPLDEFRAHELHKGDVDKVVDRVKKLKKTIALGIRGEYLLLAVGPSTERLAHLGKGKSLADRPEFKPLEKYADRRLVSIGYASQAAMARVASGTRDLQELLKSVGDSLPKFGLSADQQKEIRKDIRDLTSDLTTFDSKPGAVMSFGFLGERGVEGYSYTWGDFKHVDATKALGLLQHVGGKPILPALGRSRGSEAQYDLAVKWVKRAYHYFEEFALPQMPPDDREQFQKVAEQFRPLVKRWDKANRLLIQSTADEQFGMVIDARFHSRQFHRDLPATERPMPMIEPALVLGVSDAKRFSEAMGEYRAIFNDGVEALRKAIPDPTDLPPLSIPDPKKSQTAGGTLYTFEFPEDWGLAKEIVVSLGLSDRVAVAAMTTDHASRLLAPTSPAVGGVLGDANRPRAMAVSFDWQGLVAAARPWVELAVREIVTDEPGGEGDAPKAKKAKAEKKAANGAKKPADESKPFEKKAVLEAPAAKPPAEQKVVATPKPRKAGVLDQVRVVLKVLGVVQSITGETYQEDGALVTHTLVEIRDID